MKYPLSPTDLQRPAILQSQRREWIVERVGWALMAITLAGGLLGLFGQGPLARASRTEGPVRLDFERIVRRAQSTQLRLDIAPEAIRDNVLAVWVDEGFLKQVLLIGIAPEPASSASADGRRIYRFSSPPGGQPSHIMIDFEHRTSGARTGRLGVATGPPIPFNQVVLP